MPKAAGSFARFAYTSCIVRSGVRSLSESDCEVVARYGKTESPKRVGTGVFLSCAMREQFELELGERPHPRPKARHYAGLSKRQVLPAVFQTGSQSNPAGSAHAKPAKAKSALLQPGPTAGDAFQLIARECRWHIAANLPAVIYARDPEGMHQLRVGLRRLRVALTSFGRDFRTPAVENVRLQAKSVASQLAPARDLDIFVGELFKLAARANGAAEAFGALQNRAAFARRRAWDHAVDYLMSPPFICLLRALTDLTGDHGKPGQPIEDNHARQIALYNAPAGRFTEKILTHRFKQLKKCGRGFEHLSTGDRHDLRIALKKMRYTSEFFAPLYPATPAAKFVKRLAKMQEALGALNDVATAYTILDRLVAVESDVPLASRSDLSFAAGIVYGWQLERADRLWKDAVNRWNAIRKIRPFWNA